MKIHVIHALPNSFLPTPGNRLYVVGISIETAKELVKENDLISHVRYPDFCEKLSSLLGVEISPSGENCPTPIGLANEAFILASQSPGSVDVNFYHLYDGSKERADYDWRYSMTEFA